MAIPCARQLVEFAQTIRLSHTLFALPFALGTALAAEPPWPGWAASALLAACLVAARTAAMGMNRVADAAIDARNPRTADRAIPAGRLSPRAALGLTLAAGTAFLALAWGFYVLRGNPWPGLLAPAFLAVLFGYSYAKRFTTMAHWVLGFCLGLAPVGVWIALRGDVSPAAAVIGAAVLFWTAGFDILYALQDTAVDRREGLHSVPARMGPARARAVAAASHAVAAALLVLAHLTLRQMPGTPGGGRASLVALVIIVAALTRQHLRARHASTQEINTAFFRTNTLVSMMWLAGVLIDTVAGG